VAVINHGTVRGYKLGCRCEECRAANTKAKQAERDRRREREGRPAASRSAVPTPPAASPLIEGAGPIEEAAREALGTVGGDEPLAKMRREVVFRAAAVMDNPKFAPFFKSAADVLRVTVGDLLAESPAKDGEADALAGIMATFGGSDRGARGRRGAPSVDDAPKSGAGDDR